MPELNSIPEPRSEPLCGLPRAAALDTLARTIWFARGLIFNLDVPHWDALPVTTRHAYVRRAEELLATLRPAPNGDALFQQVVAVARVEAARVLAFRGLEPTWNDGVK